MPAVEAARPSPGKDPAAPGSGWGVGAMNVTVADGSNTRLRALEMLVGAVQSSGVAAREAGRDAERVRVAVRANVQASEESVADRSPLSVSQEWVQAREARLETSDAGHLPLDTSTGGVPVEDRARGVAA